MPTMLLFTGFLWILSLHIYDCKHSRLRRRTTSTTTNETLTHSYRHMQQTAGGTALAYFNSSAMSFLQEYGLTNNLYDQFFHDGHNLTGRITQSKGVPLRKEKFYEKYKVQSYKAFKTWGVATATPKPEYASLRFDYKPRASSEEIMRYNNMYRYGPHIDDRFMWIGFDRDPWSEGTAEAPANVYFVGVGTQLPEIYEYSCVFRAPKAATSPVLVTRHIPDVLSRPTENSIVRCAVPIELTQVLTAEMRDITLDLVRMPVHAADAAAVPETMLSDIRVPRLHALNRRYYQHSIQTMVEVLDDVMVSEWIVYNILLGFEHFYIYYNTKATDLSIESSILRPFLDANLVTLIYFPFLHTVHYMQVQHAALNAFHRGYGRYTQWVGFWDVDEFFLPSVAYVPYLQQPAAPYTVPIVPLITTKLGGWNEPAIMFDTLEMDCAVNSTNYYAGGDNLALMPSSSTGSMQVIREAVTTHCTRTGYFFHELQVGHGKMLVCPSRAEYIASPHRYNHYYTRWTTAQDGLMRHFNRFRNTIGAISAGLFSAAGYSSDDALRVFTLASLRELLGIAFSATGTDAGS